MSNRRVKPTGPPQKGAIAKPPGEPAGDTVREARLTPLARAFRRAYVSERSRFESTRAGFPVRYRVPARYDGLKEVATDGGLVVDKAVPPVWEKCAALLAAAGADPAAYVAAQFADTMARAAPEPAALFTPTRLADWEKVRKGLDDEVRTRLVLDEDSVAVAIRRFVAAGESHADALSLALGDPQVAASPLYRHVAAAAAGPGFERLAAYYWSSAVVQYSRARAAYREHWSKILPAGFDARAEAAMDALTGEKGSDDGDA